MKVTLATFFGVLALAESVRIGSPSATSNKPMNGALAGLSARNAVAGEAGACSPPPGLLGGAVRWPTCAAGIPEEPDVAAMAAELGNPGRPAMILVDHTAAPAAREPIRRPGCAPVLPAAPGARFQNVPGMLEEKIGQEKHWNWPPIDPFPMKAWYMNDEELAAHRNHFDGGKIFDRTGKPVDTRAKILGLQTNRKMFAIDEDNRFYSGRNRWTLRGYLSHSSFFQGNALVPGAKRGVCYGEYEAHDGVFKEVNFRTGHFHVDDEQQEQGREGLRENGVSGYRERTVDEAVAIANADEAFISGLMTVAALVFTVGAMKTAPALYRWATSLPSDLRELVQLIEVNRDALRPEVAAAVLGVSRKDIEGRLIRLGRRNADSWAGQSYRMAPKAREELNTRVAQMHEALGAIDRLSPAAFAALRAVAQEEDGVLAPDTAAKVRRELQPRLLDKKGRLKDPAVGLIVRNAPDRDAGT
ncbi:MAG: hypothetical protein ABW032_00120 [Burkholderiaceae bacterium]